MARMVALAACLSLLAAATNPSAHAAPDRPDGAVFVVAPDGDDTNPGTLERPFKTLTRARNALRGLRRQSGGTLTRPVTVWLRGGCHLLDRPLDLALQDSGTAACPVTFAAYENETPIVSAGRRVTGWQAGDGGLWHATVAGVDKPGACFRQLFTRMPGQAHFQRRYRPTLGLFVIAGLTDAPYKYPNRRIDHRNPQNEFYFHKGDIKQWANLPDVEVVVMHDWSSGRLHIDTIDLKQRIVRFTDYPHYRIGHWYPGQRNPYLVENVKEELGKPGEWYVDRPTRTLYYRPMPGEDMQRLTVIAPRFEHVLCITGDRRTQQYVEHIRFRGITFSHTAWKLAPHQYAEKYRRACRQGMVDMPSAVELKWARRCRFERCTMAHVGSYAIDLGEGCHENAVVGNRIFDCGTGGVKVGVVDRGAKPPVVSTNNVISNNIVADTGYEHYSGHGIWGGIVAGTRVTHNIVTRTLYSSVAFGWSHNRKDGACRENTIAYNHIHNVMLLLDHGGAIYTLGSQPGTVLRGNLVHDTYQTKLHGRKRPAWTAHAFGFDDGSSGFTVEGNIVYNIPCDPAMPLERGKKLHTIGTNYLGIQPTDKRFPHALANKAGLEPEYRDLLDEPIKVPQPAVLRMQLPADLPPVRIVDDFERLKVGQTTRKAYTRTEHAGPAKGTDAIQVTDTTAAGGKHSLMILDAPGLSHTWVPYLSYNPAYDSGKPNVAFDLRIATDTHMEHAWRGRSEKRQFATGPQFQIKGAQLTIAGKPVMRIPADTWVHVEVAGTLGRPDPGIGRAGLTGHGRWTLTVRLPGQPPRSFRALVVTDKEFHDLNWIGFISLATQRTRFYLDNVRITNP